MSFLSEDDPQIIGSVAPGGETSFGDVFKASMRATVSGQNTFARAEQLEAAYDRRIDDIYKATGVRLVNPMRAGDGGAGEFGLEAPDPFAEFDGELVKLSRQHADKRDVIRPDRSPRLDAYEKVRTDAEAEASTLARYRGPVGSGALAQFSGALVGGLRDPVNIMALPLGGGAAGQGVKGVIWMGIKQGAINAGLETALQPAVARWRTEAGLGYSASDFALNVGTAFAFGAGLDAGVRGAARSIRRLRGDVARLDESGNVVGWETAEQALDRAALLSELDTLRKARSGDTEALKMLARETGADADPVVRSAIEVADDIDATSVHLAGVDPHDTIRVELQMARHLRNPDEPAPVAPEPLPEPVPLDLFRVTRDERASVAAAAQKSLQQRAERAEYLRGKLERFNGAVDQLADRMAQELGRWPDLFDLRRAIDDGKLSVVEMANVMRHVPDVVDQTMAPLPARVADAREVARLSDPAFEMVQRGDATPELGAAVARHVPEPANHAAVLASVAAAEPRTAAEARRLIKVATPLDRFPEQQVPPSRWGIDDPTGPEAAAQIASLEARLGLAEPEERPKLDDAAIVTALEGRPVPEAHGFGAGVGDILRALKTGGTKAAGKAVTEMAPAKLRDAAARLAGEMGAGFEPLSPKAKAALLSARGLRRWADELGESDPAAGGLRRMADELEASAFPPEKPVDWTRAAEFGARPADKPKIAHPNHAGLKIATEPDGTVLMFHGVNPDAKVGRFGRRIFTTDLERALKNVGAGELRVVRLAPEELALADPRRTTGGRVKADEQTFVLDEAIAARAETAPAGIEALLPKAVRAALGNAPEAGFRRSMDDVEALIRMREIIEGCKE